MFCGRVSAWLRVTNQPAYTLLWALSHVSPGTYCRLEILPDDPIGDDKDVDTWRGCHGLPHIGICKASYYVTGH